MIRKFAIAYAITIIILILIVSCAAPKLIPAPTPEPEIPVSFTTYTSEGLFNISYPQDWVPATSMMEELFEQMIDTNSTNKGPDQP